MKTPLRLDKIQHLVFSTDGTRLAADFIMAQATLTDVRLVTDVRLGLKVWDVKSGKELLTPEGNTLLSGLAVSPDGARVAWVGSGKVRVWDIGSGREQLDVPEPWSMSLFPSFSADGSRLAWAGDRRVRVWDMDAAREVVTISDPGGYVGPLALSPDGSRLAGAVGQPWAFDEVKMWDAATGREILSVKIQRLVSDLAFSPDGSRLASFRWQHDQEGDRREATLWDAARRAAAAAAQRRRRLRQHRAAAVPARRPPAVSVQHVPPRPGGGDAYEVWDATPTADEGK